MWAVISALCLLLSDFIPALPGYDFHFPRDHGSHDQYRTEWWYYTGHLQTDNGHRYGFEVTFFRVGVVPPEPSTTGNPDCPAGQDCPPATRWDLHDLALAHFAVTDIDRQQFRYAEKLNRESPFTAWSSPETLDVVNEGWSATTMPDGAWHLVASSGGDSVDLVMRSRKPPAIHGENGVSVKAECAGCASHYYSMTRLEVSGSIDRQRSRGIAWMDHEFGSSQLQKNQRGWDWFSIQFDDDTELMLYQIRRSDGTPDVTSSGSFVTSDGSVIHIRSDQMRIQPLGTWHSSRSGATYPMGWRISVPGFGIAVTLNPSMKNQELVTHASTNVTYWEGAVDVNGSSRNTSVSGVGYVEMTGYDHPFRSY
ncbi:MAG TPA: lipocalin-like domain-containing protein [Thermoanaerobaculia bacterium]|nr:lipocalin-like domain-containing protein [Thermoanaerobaculia bacterium]